MGICVAGPGTLSSSWTSGPMLAMSGEIRFPVGPVEYSLVKKTALLSAGGRLHDKLGAARRRNQNRVFVARLSQRIAVERNHLQGSASPLT